MFSVKQHFSSITKPITKLGYIVQALSVDPAGSVVSGRSIRAQTLRVRFRDKSANASPLQAYLHNRDAPTKAKSFPRTKPLSTS